MSWFNKNSQFTSLLEAASQIHESASTEAVQRILKTKFNGRKLKDLSQDEKKVLFGMVDKMVISKSEKAGKEDKKDYDDKKVDNKEKTDVKESTKAQNTVGVTDQGEQKPKGLMTFDQFMKMTQGGDVSGSAAKSSVKAKNSTSSKKSSVKSMGVDGLPATAEKNKSSISATNPGSMVKEEDELDEVLDTKEVQKRASARARQATDDAKAEYLSKGSKDTKKWERKARQFNKFKEKFQKEEVELDEETNEYKATSHESSSGVHHPVLLTPEGKLEYRGGISYKNSKAAKGEAKAYHDGYFGGPFKGNETRAKSMVKTYRKNNAKHLHNESVEIEQLDEKSVSKKQQKFFGLVRAIQKGKASGSPEAEKAAKEMSVKDVKDFAETKHKGLPEKKK